MAAARKSRWPTPIGNLYTHIMPAMHREAADRMDELLSGT